MNDHNKEPSILYFVNVDYLYLGALKCENKTRLQMLCKNTF